MCGRTVATRQPHALGALAGSLLAEDDEPRARYHLLEEPLVVTHHQLAVDLLHGLERHADADQERRAAKGIVVMCQSESRIDGVSATAARNKLPGRVILFRIRAR